MPSMDQWLHSPTLPFYPDAPWWATFVGGFVVAIFLTIIFRGKKKKGS